MDREELEELGAFGAILVPIFGNELDDDIMQTAGRLAGESHDDFDSEEGALIEALWIFEIPMSLPIDARLPDGDSSGAGGARAREGGRGGVRGRRGRHRHRPGPQRRAGDRRGGAAPGVEAIVLAAEEPTRIRGGALLGGRSGANEGFAGAITKYVLAKATCQVILTAPAARDEGAQDVPLPRPPAGAAVRSAAALAESGR